MQATNLLEKNANRKRSRSGFEESNFVVGSTTTKAPPVICLSGFSSEEKNKYHAWIQQLGGTFTRYFDTEQNTHLIAKETSGEKYETARAAGPSKVQIVTPVWIEECFRKQEWIPVRPSDHCHDDDDDDDDDDNVGETGDNNEDAQKLPTTNNVSSNPPRVVVPLLSELLQQVWPLDNPLISDTDDARFTLFSPCHMTLVGFDPDAPDFVSLCQLIRLGMGRLAWTINEQITHVVIPDGTCDETVRDAAHLMRTEHPNAPEIVSPLWIIMCWEKGVLLDSSSGFEPQFLPKKGDTKAAAMQKLEAAKKKHTNDLAPSNLFRGCLFTLLRVAPPSWAVDYDTKEIEQLIQSTGGQLLTPRVVDALLIDNHAAATNAATTVKKSKRKCFVVCWGGDVDSNLTMHATLAQVRHLVDVIPITPTWLHTCRFENKLVSRSRCRTMFQPTPWPTRRLMISNNNKSSSSSTTKPIHIAISGFSGSLRSALIHWITAMGGGNDNENIYQDAMDDHTTHLVCASSNSEKFKKAKKRNLHVVSLDWIFHVAQYGYNGKNGEKDRGCERLFHVEEKPTV